MSHRDPQDPQAGPVFLERPEVEFSEFQGHLLSAYVRLMKGTAVRDVQPNPDVPVYFYLDAEGWPVGARFYAPVDGAIVVEILDTMVTDGYGSPQAMDRQVHSTFRSAKEVIRFLQAVNEVKEKLSRAGA